MGKILLLILALVPGMALAQNIFQPVADDKSMEILAAMFGDTGMFLASASDAFSGVMTVFNGAVLAIGGILAAYTILAGTIGTAHDGEMLGKKFSSVWVPIRTALGTAAILPMVKGYCVMQLLVAWVIIQGIGLADAVWSSYMSASNIAKTVVVSMEKPQVKALAWNAFGSLTCMRAYEKIYTDTRSGPAGAIYPPLKFGTSSDTSAPGKIITSFGVTTEAGGFFKDSCGSLSIENTTPLPAGNASGDFNLLGDLSSLNGDLSSADAAHVTAVNTMIASLDGIAKAFAANPNNTAGIEAQVSAAAAAYETTTKAAAAGIVAKLADFHQLEQSATKDGWMLAGAWFMRMAYLSEVAQKAVAKVPEASGASGSVNKVFSDQYEGKYLKPLLDLKSKSISAGEFGIANSESQSSSAESGGAGLWDWIKSGFSADKLIKKVFRADAITAGASNEHPVMAMKRVGNWAGIAAGAMYIKYVGALFAVGAAQGSGTSVAIATLPLAMIVFPALMAVSFSLSFVLPMMPFMIWIGVILGWIILCVEAMIAAPVWAVMHLSPHGDDLTGTGGQGYRLVLSLMLRPVLMVFGLIAALTIITVFGQMINKVFWDVFMLSQQDSNIIIWLVGLIAAPLVYFGLMLTIIKKTMDVIHIIPDQLLGWFGGGGQQLGNYGSAIGGEGARSYTAIAGVADIGGRGLDAKRNALDLNKQVDQAGQAKLSNELKRQSDSAESKGQVDKKLGSGGGELVERALAESGQDASQLSSLDGQKLTSKMEGGVNALGGKDSSAAMSFKENMAADMDGGASFNTAFENNMKSGLDQKFGAGSGEFIQESSGGKFAGSGFAKGVEQLGAVKSHYEGKGLSTPEVAEKTSALLDAAKANHAASPSSSANGGDRDLNYYVDKKLDFAKDKDKQ